MTPRLAASARFAEYVRKMTKCGHWELTGNRDSHVAEIRHIATGVTLAYQTHDGGNDRNAARNFAKEASQICGCTFINPRGRKQSRKRADLTGYQPERSTSERAASSRVAQLRSEWIKLAQEWDPAAEASDIAACKKIVGRLSDVEHQLRDLYQPPPDGQSWRLPEECSQ